MRDLYLIPDRECLTDSLTLRESQGVLWEYNDFFQPEILSDKKMQLKIIDEYASTGVDFSRDTMHGAFLDVTLHSNDPLIREVSGQRVRQSMEIAKEMGLRGVVFHSNRIHGFREQIYLKNWVDANEKFFRNLTEEFPDIGIFMENMWDESPDMLIELAERLRDIPEFALCMDYGHAVLSGYPPTEWLRESAPYTVHMHINDNDGESDQHLALGAGIIDWKEFDRGIHICGLDATVLLEVNGIERQKESLAYLRERGLTSLIGGDRR